MGGTCAGLTVWVIQAASFKFADAGATAVAGDPDSIVPERWWVPGGDPAVPAFGRRLSAEEVAALPKSSSH